MARWDPRYGTNGAYAAGEGLVTLAQLLRQGFVDYNRQQSVDEESQRRDQDLMLRLQQFMTGAEDRDLDRQIRQETLGLQRETAANTRADRAAAAGVAEAGRSGLAKLLKLNPTVEETQPPPAEFASDPERLQPNVLQALVPRKRTYQEAITAGGLTDQEAGHKDVVDALMKFYAPPKEEKAPEPYTLSPGQQRRDAQNRVVAEAPAKVDEPSAPTSEVTIRQAARDALVKRGIANPTDEAIATEAVAIKERLGKAGASTTTIKLGAEERKDERLAVNTETIGKSLLERIKRNPDWVGGPLGAKGRLNSVRAMLDAAPQGFPDFESDLDKMSADMINILAGAALSPNEEKRYTRSIPKISDSTQKFESNLRTTIENARRLRGYIQARERGEKLAPPTPADEDTAPPGFTPR